MQYNLLKHFYDLVNMYEPKHAVDLLKMIFVLQMTEDVNLIFCYGIPQVNQDTQSQLHPYLCVQLVQNTQLNPHLFLEYKF